MYFTSQFHLTRSQYSDVIPFRKIRLLLKHATTLRENSRTITIY